MGKRIAMAANIIFRLWISGYRNLVLLRRFIGRIRYRTFPDHFQDNTTKTLRLALDSEHQILIDHWALMRRLFWDIKFCKFELEMIKSGVSGSQLASNPQEHRLEKPWITANPSLNCTRISKACGYWEFWMLWSNNLPHPTTNKGRLVNMPK